MPRPFILASTSPRRQEMLKAAGFSFEVVAPEQEDDLPAGNSLAPKELVLSLALVKAAAVAAKRPEAIVLAADTVVVLGDKILGKPASGQEAEAMLRLLSGQVHQVLTGFCLEQGGLLHHTEVVMTEVEFRDLSLAEIKAYVASGSPLDKAGAYGIQDLGGGLVKRLNGSYTNVVGLPLAEVIEALARLGIKP